MTAADQLITRLSLQVNETFSMLAGATARITELEKSERQLQDRVHHLEWTLQQNGIDVPPMP